MTQTPDTRRTLTDVKAWLKRKPWPDAIRVDGKSIVQVTNNANKWAECCESILAMKGHVLEALDRKGNVVRACDITPQGERDAPEADAKPETNWPATELGVLAKIITESNDRAAMRHENAYRIAFDRVVGLVELCLARVSGLEEAWTQELARRAQAVEERELNAGTVQSNAQGEQLLATVMQHGMLQMSKPAGTKVGPAKPNGG